MTRRLNFILRVTLGLVLAACVLSGRALAQSNIEMHRQGIGADDGKDWRLAESTRGGFSVDMPVAFSDFTQSGTDTKIGAFAVYTIGGTSSRGAKYSVTRMAITEKMKRPDIKTMADGFRGTGNTVSNVRLLNGPLGEEISFDMAAGAANASVRYVLNSESLFTMIVEWPNSESQAVAGLRDRFFDSLKLTPAAK